MKLNREQIMKALACCGNTVGCDSCPAEQPGYACIGYVMRQSLAIIKELIEENERLILEHAGFKAGVNQIINTIKSDTVQTMQDRLLDEAWQSGIVGMHIFSTDDIHQIAKEMLEDKHG